MSTLDVVQLAVLLLSLISLLILNIVAQYASSNNTLELSVGLSLSPRDSFYFNSSLSEYLLFPMSNATMFTKAIPALQDGPLFLPILNSPSFNSSNSSQSPGFSFGFFFSDYDYNLEARRIYLAVCGGLSGNFSNVSNSATGVYGANDSQFLEVPSVMDGYVVPVWIANPTTSLRSVNASLVVVEVQGGTKQLQLKDHDDIVLWNVSNVGLMEMHDTGILTIYDTLNRAKVVWESPRDTLFRGEKLGVGMQLTSNDSSYSARFEKGGLVFYVNTVEFMGERPAPYWAIPALLNYSDNPLNVSNMVMSSPCSSGPSINDTAYAFVDEYFQLDIFLGSCGQQNFDGLSMNPSTVGSMEYNTAGPLSFVKLENDGWLRNYAVPLDLAGSHEPSLLPFWDEYIYNYTVGSGILQVYLYANCFVPYACGPLGVCTAGQKSPCTCPMDPDPSSSQAATTFLAISENDSSKGCRRRRELPKCTKDEHVNTTDFLQLNHTASIFLFSGWLFNSTTPAKVETCKSTCSSKCSCNGFFYQANNSACFFITDEMSLLNLTQDLPLDTLEWPAVDIHRSNYVTYLKKAKANQTGQSSPSSQALASPSSPSGLAKSTVIAIAIASSFAAFVGAGFTIMLLHSRARKRKLFSKQARQAEEELREVLPLLPSRFSYQDLHEATKGFSELLGAGGCGSVYAGMLQDGRKVAVKTLEFSMKADQQTKQFLAEVATIGQTSHHNIVRLVGFCWEVSNRLLVYDYMERGSLDHWLFHKPPPADASCDDEGSTTPLLDWQTRFNVVLGIVRGLSYLHEECPQPILHFDIKPQNILLDGNFVAKLADFGMSRLMNRDVSEVVTGLRGTPGYIAPEWLLHGAVSKKGDIYSMGMVMLEIVGGRKNVDLELLNKLNEGLEEGERHEPWHFPSWAAKKCELGREMELVDKQLQGTFNETEARRLIYTAFWCIQEDPAMRPYAPTALQWLQGSSPIKQPPFSKASHSGSSFSCTPSTF